MISCVQIHAQNKQLKSSNNKHVISEEDEMNTEGFNSEWCNTLSLQEFLLNNSPQTSGRLLKSLNFTCLLKNRTPCYIGEIQGLAQNQPAWLYPNTISSLSFLLYPSNCLRILSLSFSAFQAWSFSFFVGVRFFCLAAMMRRKASITSLSATRTHWRSSCFLISSLANLNGWHTCEKWQQNSR